MLERTTYPGSIELWWNGPVEGALIALAGVLLGWLLGQGGDLFSSRRQARDAARVVVAELVQNIATIRHARSLPAGWRVLVEVPLPSVAWETQKLSLTRVVEVGLVLRLASDYQAIGLLNVSARVMADVDGLRTELDGSTEGRAPSKSSLLAFETAITSAQSAAQRALRELGPIGDLSGVGLVLLKQGRRRQRKLWLRDRPALAFSDDASSASEPLDATAKVPSSAGDGSDT